MGGGGGCVEIKAISAHLSWRLAGQAWAELGKMEQYGSLPAVNIVGVIGKTLVDS